uniref:(northern house mosquito) hypothetical protein n=1 Tax=Culex pipiens TaxID=7175 RepID=A0A8D8B903_CULPI
MTVLPRSGEVFSNEICPNTSLSMTKSATTFSSTGLLGLVGATTAPSSDPPTLISCTSGSCCSSLLTSFAAAATTVPKLVPFSPFFFGGTTVTSGTFSVKIASCAAFSLMPEKLRVLSSSFLLVFGTTFVTIRPFGGSSFASSVTAAFGGIFLLRFFGRMMRRSGVVTATVVGVIASSPVVDRCFLLTISPLLMTFETTSLAPSGWADPWPSAPAPAEVDFFLLGDPRTWKIPDAPYRRSEGDSGRLRPLRSTQNSVLGAGSGTASSRTISGEPLSGDDGTKLPASSQNVPDSFEM